MTTTIRGTDNSAASPALVGTDTDTGVFFPAAGTTAFSQNGTESMRIASTGYVGIGTNNPIEILEVQGGKIRVTDALGAVPASYDAGELTSLINTNSAGPDNRVITLGASPAPATNGTSFEAVSGYIRSIGNLSFVTTSTERVRIDTSGNVLVGTTSIVGFGKTSIKFDQASSWGMGIQNTSATATGTFIGFVNSSGTTQGAIVQTNSTTTAYNTTSDYRLKENIAPMTGALSVVSQLKPVTYNWKVDGSASQGFIAHELQAVVPDCVTGEKDAVDAEGKPVYQGIDTSFLVATLTAAIQELKTELDGVKAELVALKAQSLENK